MNGSFDARNGLAFEGLAATWIAPALTATGGVYRVNFGERPFRYAAPDGTYLSVHEAHRRAMQRPHQPHDDDDDDGSGSGGGGGGDVV